MKNKRWLLIIPCYITIVAISNVFRFQAPFWYKEFTLPFGLTNFKYLLESVFLFIGYFISRIFTNNKLRITPLGIYPKRNILMLLIPLILFTILGAKNEFNLNPHYYGFILGITITSYVLFEEFGWRGFLQNELSGTIPTIRYTLIGLLWYLWHLSFLSTETSLQEELKFLAIFVFLSWGIGQIANKTRSIFACAYFHLIGSVISFSPLIDNSLDKSEKYLVAFLLTGFGIFIVNLKIDKVNLMTR